MNFHLENIDEIDSPALVIFKSQVEQNIAHAVQMVGDVNRLRPHIKTHKSADATKLMLQVGITKFKCATIAEAEMLGQCGAADVLLAYQPVGPKVGRFVEVIKKHTATRYSCLIDDIAAAKNMAAIYAENGLVVPVYIDLNIGQNRTGIAPRKAADLYIACGGLYAVPLGFEQTGVWGGMPQKPPSFDELPKVPRRGENRFEQNLLASKITGIKPVGLQAYDGHIREIDFEKKKAICDEGFKAVELVVAQIKAAGFDDPVVVAGGSPTFSIHSKRTGVECSPGTFVYWDKGYLDICPEQPFKPAAVLVSRVISLPDDTKICLDLGHKSVAAENELTKRIYFPAYPDLIPIGQSEEHLVMEAGANHGLKVGHVLLGIPYHICPTVALYERAYIVENGAIISEWKTTARDRFINNGKW